jgi:hypothetical protein
MQRILSFKNCNFTLLREKDETNRVIGVAKIKEAILVGRNDHNPNVLLYSLNSHQLISPYDEKVMSLNRDSFYENNEYELGNIRLRECKVNEPVFFFIYNFDNYYHFLYDTLPYLFTFFELKKHHPTLKLLLHYPNPTKTEFYKFNLDMLSKLVSIEKDIILHSNNNCYSNVYVSSSLTHGGYSNNPPRQEVYNLFDSFISICKPREKKETPKRIYISRRTWVNNDSSNIGTNYTTRRKMMNEDELVERLEEIGFVEVFAENLSQDEKIEYFSNAEIIVGSIGGGMANLLFSTKATKALVLVTPYFLDINFRFQHSLNRANTKYFTNIQTYFDKEAETEGIPMFCRVQINKDNDDNNKKIGEIISYDSTLKMYIIQISSNDVVGFNNEVAFEKSKYCKEDFILLDQGLNSPYVVPINDVLKEIE